MSTMYTTNCKLNSTLHTRETIAKRRFETPAAVSSPKSAHPKVLRKVILLRTHATARLVQQCGRL